MAGGMTRHDSAGTWLRTSGLSGATGVCMETVAGIADGERCCIPVGERLSRERPARCGELAGLDEHGGMCRSAVDVGPVCHGHRGEGQSPRLKVYLRAVRARRVR